ncbi:transcriptional repressor [Marivirga sp. S37H4]|uniref:Transcriptional repressor n=1 Tax=Marivirga aurantiaca TaxID=2802615 RepID=A0A935C845_9BACT|nr:transcriptional repressor [Marivirga aurantiaca]MBK6263488.1 transcriptional repressor [Marivirga aurantiaca]
MVTLTDIKDKLTEANLKITHQRLVIYEALLKCMNHPTAEYIYDKIKEDNPSVSLGTVHKTLDKFVEVDLAKKVLSTDHLKRFDANISKHNHIYLENSKEIIDYHDEELQQIILDYLKKKKLNNIKIKDVQLQINADKIDKKLSVSIK